MKQKKMYFSNLLTCLRKIHPHENSFRISFTSLVYQNVGVIQTITYILRISST